MNKKVLLVTQPSCGGAERMTLLYGKILEKAGYEIDLYMPLLRGKGDMLTPFIPSNWHTYTEKCRYKYLIFKLFRYIKQCNPSVIFCSLSSYSCLILLLKRLHLINCPIIIRDCNMPSKHIKSVLRQSKWLYPISDMLISQTQEMKDEMVEYYKIPAERIAVINNPVDKDLILQKLSEYVDLPLGYINFMACSRIFPQKDIATMLNAFALVKEKQKKSKLYIIGREGTNEYMQELYAIIKEKKLSEDVLFVGFQENPFKYLKLADVFVLSSIYEGLPNVMLEAMYLGKPVAVTECIPFISQVVRNGENGYKCETNNPEALAECMLRANDIKNLPIYNDVTKSEKKVIEIFESVLKSIK